MALSRVIIASTRDRTWSFIWTNLARSSIRLSWRCLSEPFSS